MKPGEHILSTFLLCLTYLTLVLGLYRGWLCGYYISRWVTYFLEQKVVCSYTAGERACE